MKAKSFSIWFYAAALYLVLGTSSRIPCDDYASVWQCDQSKFNWYCQRNSLRQQENKASRVIDITKIKERENLSGSIR